MKTVEKRYFVCEICGRTSQDEGKIAECQKSHHLITDDCLVEHSFNKGQPFPRGINVTFPDGSYAQYVLNLKRDAPMRPESIEERVENAD